MMWKKNQKLQPMREKKPTHICTHKYVENKIHAWHHENYISCVHQNYPTYANTHIV